MLTSIAHPQLTSTSVANCPRSFRLASSILPPYFLLLSVGSALNGACLHMHVFVCEHFMPAYVYTCHFVPVSDNGTV